ncbi:hypothetical protein D3C72_2574080 [compost metagenome]
MLLIQVLLLGSSIRFFKTQLKVIVQNPDGLIKLVRIKTLYPLGSDRLILHICGELLK